MLRSVSALVVVLAACGPSTREVTVAEALPGSCLDGRVVNEVRVVAMGDAPPVPGDVVSATADGQALLPLRPGTRAVLVEGIGPTGVTAFGRTPTLDLGALFGTRIAVAYAPADTLCTTGRLNYARTGHRATALPTGDALISGGVDADGFPVPRLEIYRTLDAGDGAAATFRIVDLGGPTALDARAALGHAVAVLADGGVIITGGAPARNGLAHGIAFEGMTRHGPDGLLVGTAGLIGGGPRAFHTATTLPDGRVLLAGGCTELVMGDCVAGKALDSTTLYDPQTGTFADGPRLLVARWDHDAVARGDGKVLLVGGRGDGPDPDAELVNPTGISVAAGMVGGHAAALPGGAVLAAGGSGTASAAATWWAGPGETLALPPLPAPRSGHTVTAFEDGSVLVAGGAGQLLALYDARGQVVSLGPFGRLGHTATRLGDGSVLLAGGGINGIGSTDAFVVLRSPVGPWSSLPAITFDGSGGLIPRRPDRVVVAGGRLRVTATGAGDRPTEWALVPGMVVGDATVALFAGRQGGGRAALLLGFRSEADFAFVTLAAGEPVTLSSGCSGAVLDAAELPDGDVAPFTVEIRNKTVVVSTPARELLRCEVALPRGQVGIGAAGGVALFDDLTITR